MTPPTPQQEDSEPGMMAEQTDSTQMRPGKDKAQNLPPDAFRPVLLCLAGPLRGQRRALTDEALVIGRSGGSDWRLNDSSASRRHARIVYENHASPSEKPVCWVEDLGSRNGTEVNGEIVSGRRTLEERDRILVGTTVLGFFVRDTDELKHDESLWESATRDLLTGLDNRRQLTEHMKHHLARAQRQAAPLTFVLLDLDHFKSVNDRFGHDAGDDALRMVAGVLKQNCRETDMVARWGGEEFALCLPDTNAEQAMLLTERLRRSVAKNEIPVSGQILRLTVSIGGTTYRQGDDSMTMFQRADRMLYKAKNSGRNRVEFSDDTADL